MTSTEWMTVFADGIGGGNPCPVVFDFTGSAAQMQAMTGEFGVETVFVLPGVPGDTDAELCYFVPRHEMEMCVHATIAATTLLAESGRSVQRLTTKLGTLTVEWSPAQSRVTVAQFPAVFGAPVAEAGVLQALQLDADALAGEIVSVSTARAKLIVPLRDEATLDALQPDYEQLWTLCDELGVTGLYPFAPVDRVGVDVAARQFPLRTGYVEDPATGVAAAALAAYLTRPAPAGWHSWRIAQGRAMGRPSLITAEARSAGDGAIVETRVGGQARRLGPGERRSLD